MNRDLLQALEKLIKPLRSRFSTLIQRGIIHQADKNTLQVSFAEGDTQESIRKYEPFGFTSQPPEQSEALVLFPSGFRSVGFSVATRGPEPIPTGLERGESAQYNNEGSFIALRQGGKFELKNKDAELISVLVEFLEKCEEMSKYLVASAQGVHGPCSVARPQVDLSGVREKLKSFKM